MKLAKFKIFGLSLLVLTLAWLIPVVRADWAAPLSAPPACNSGDPGCDAPINVSGVAQVKNGGLTAGVLRSFSDIYADGDIGIGNVNPAYKLDVYGDVNVASTSAYRYNGLFMGLASTTLRTFFVGGAGNLNLLTTAGSDNTGLGYAALSHVNSGFSNSAVGSYALNALTSGNSNVAIGSAALLQLTTGYGNFAIGRNALYSNTTGLYNLGIGNYSGFYTTGAYNVGVGNSTLFSNTTGSNNVAIGHAAGYSLTTGGTNTFIGYNAGYNALQKVDATNSMALGYNTYTTANNQVVIGNSSITQTLLNGSVGVGITAPSQKLEVNGGVRLNTTNAKPSCDATVRGTTWFTQGASGVKDTLEVCAKDATDAYAWRSLY